MDKGILHTHYLVVVLFLLIYVIKTVLLLSNRSDLLQKFSKKVKVPEMIVSFLFLGTGIYLMTKVNFKGDYTHLLWIKIGMVLLSIPLAVVGFKKQNKILAALSLLLITGAFGLAEVYHKKNGNNDRVLSSSMSGKEMYENKCSQCHGNDGKLGASGAKDLTITQLDVASVKETILHGRGAMQPVAVTEEQAGLIADYVNAELKGK